jgi:MFS family permease
MSNAVRLSPTLLWTQVVLAAVAMVMTIPGRTQGLGLITEPLLRDPQLGLDSVKFAALNGAATLLGAAFALPFGWMLDRWGVRLVLTLNLVLLGVSTTHLAAAVGVTWFFTGLLLIRGFGQSALSATSLTLVGKWFPGRLAKAMAVFSVISGIGFGLLFGGVGALVGAVGWREAWLWLGAGSVVLGCLAWVLCRDPQRQELNATSNDEEEGVRLGEALRSWPFWVFALSGGLFNWVSSGIGLFNEDVLAEIRFDRKVFETAVIISALFTLIMNGLAGWLATFWSLPRLMAAGMLLLAVCLAWLPTITATWQVYLNAAVLGSSAGLVMVVFFTCWGVYFGRRHLGKIQGFAQAITVLASALGPISLALVRDSLGTYKPLFLVLAGLAVTTTLALTFTRGPAKSI